MKKHCGVCKQELDVPLAPETLDCGGDCLRCMADAGDPDCVASMHLITASHDDFLAEVRRRIDAGLIGGEDEL